jgi:hypothetical protein
MLVLLSLLALGSIEDAEGIEPVTVRLAEGAHPKVFVTAKELAEVRRLTEEEPWARSVRERLMAQADALVAEPVEIPREGGQWSHWFTCKEDGARLQSKSPTEHVCPKCGHVYSGPPYDQVYVSSRHHHWLSGVETLGRAYALEPKAAYAERARDILLEYASFYASLPLHDTRGGTSSAKARLFAQTLDESVILCQICVGCDALWSSEAFDETVRQRIRDGLLLPMVETIRANDRGISNWQSWHNAAVGCVGFLLDDAALVDAAVNGEHGFVYQMRHSLLPDGLWYEASPSYHWYALRAHVYLLEAAQRAGMNLYGLPPVKGMFDAPLRILLPDGTFPPINDSDRSSIRGQADFYAIAYRRYGDPRYRALRGEGRSADVLFWGARKGGYGAAPAPEPGDEAVDGLAILRDPERETAAYLDFSPGASGHVHPAKLGLVLYAHGDIRLVDPGRLAYGNPLHREWYTRTVAHNTVVVGEEDQARTDGRLVEFAQLPGGISVARAACDTAYPGVSLDRTLLRRGNVLVDVFRCRSEVEQTYDLPLHFRGELRGLPANLPLGGALSEKPGYRALEDVRRLREPVKRFDVDCGKGKMLRVEVFDGAGEAFLARGHGNPPTEMLPVLIRRQRAPEAVFVTVYHVLGEGQQAETVACEAGMEPTIRIGDATVTVGEKVVAR